MQAVEYMVYPLRVRRGRPAHHAVYFVPIGQQNFGQITSVLARNAED
jgi:hypothetical protein